MYTVSSFDFAAHALDPLHPLVLAEAHHCIRGTACLVRVDGHCILLKARDITPGGSAAQSMDITGEMKKPACAANLSADQDWCMSDSSLHMRGNEMMMSTYPEPNPLPQANEGVVACL